MRTITDKIEEEDIIELMYELHAERKAFWSEADFQHTFAWKLKEVCPAADIRLERRYTNGSKGSGSEEPYYVDIWVELRGRCYPIELKYKTAAAKIKDFKDGQESNFEYVELKPQSAQDMGRYDYIKDIVRLEHISQTYTFGKGFAIILTNDFHYYMEPKKEVKTLDREFRIHENTELEAGKFCWTNSKDQPFTYQGQDEIKHWTKVYPPLELSAPYEMSWKPYSGENTASSTSPELFRFAVSTVEKPMAEIYYEDLVPIAILDKNDILFTMKEFISDNPDTPTFCMRVYCDHSMSFCFGLYERFSKFAPFQELNWKQCDPSIYTSRISKTFRGKSIFNMMQQFSVESKIFQQLENKYEYYSTEEFKGDIDDWDNCWEKE